MIVTDAEIIKAWDVLCKFDFFGGQRAGRELWNEKPTDIQDKDIEAFANDVKFLKDFINRQKAEIERLVEHTKEGIELAKQLPETIKLSQAEAIKEFAERVKEKAHITPVFDSYCGNTYMGNVLKVYVADIDNLVKEMVGDFNGKRD